MTSSSRGWAGATLAQGSVAALGALCPVHCTDTLVHTAPPQKKKTTTIAVEVKKSQHKYVIGPKGNSLQEILERTGVSVEIPPSDSASETVILRGEPEKLGQALTEVYAKVTSRGSEDQGGKGALTLASPPAWCAWEQTPQTHGFVSWFPRPTVSPSPPSLLPPGSSVSSSARKGRTWPKSLSRCQR